MPPRRRSAVWLLVPIVLAPTLLYSFETQRASVTDRSIAQSVVQRWASHKPQARRPLDYLQAYAAQEPADYPQQCREHYHGLPYFQEVNRTWQQSVCSPQEGGPLGSSISCFYLFDAYAEAHCSGANLALDLAKFAEEEEALPKGVTNRDENTLFIEHPRPGLAGELRGDCKLHGSKWEVSRFNKGGQMWLFRGFRSTLGDAASKQPRCVAWVEHPVYFLNDKYDSVNLWHALEDVTHAFEAYAMKGWPAREPQVVVLDQVSVESVLGPTYLPVWQKVFSPKHPPKLLSQMVADAVARAGEAARKPGAALCFRDAFFAVHGGISILSRSIAEPTPCVNSTFIRAMSNFITDGLQLTDVRPASHGGAQQQQGQQAAGRKVLPPHETGGGGGRPPLRVTWALRTNRAGLQAEILKALQKRIPAETGAQVVAVDFGTKSVEEQMRLVRGSDVLAGYHGAALTLACFMHRQSALVEVEEEWRCACYTNCARWNDLVYKLIRTVDYGNEAGPVVDKVVEEVAAALAEVRRRIGAGAAAT